MFDIGFAELLIIAVVALVVLGPEKLPTAVKTVGLWVGRIRRTVSSIQSEISEELKVDEMRRTTAIQKQELERELREMSQPFGAAKGDIESMTSMVDIPHNAEENGAQKNSAQGSTQENSAPSSVQDKVEKP